MKPGVQASRFVRNIRQEANSRLPRNAGPVPGRRVQLILRRTSLSYLPGTDKVEACQRSCPGEAIRQSRGRANARLHGYPIPGRSRTLLWKSGRLVKKRITYSRRACLLRCGDAGDRLRRQRVERTHRELQVLRLRVLELRVREAAERLDEEHHRRHSRTRDLGRIVERTARQPVRLACDLAHGLVRELDQLVVEEDRLDVPDPLPLDLDVLLLRD